MFTSQEFLESISPARRFSPLQHVTLPHIVFCEKCDRDLNNFDVRSAEFWLHLDTYFDSLIKTKRFERLWDIYVSPFAAASANSEDSTGLVAGKITRAEHCIDVALVAREYLEYKVKVLRKEITPEEIMLTIRGALFHDLAVFAQSHTTEDSLRVQGYPDVDHDILLQFSLSDLEILEIDRTFGVDSKRANAALLPISLHLTSADERFIIVEENGKTLEDAYQADKDLATKLNAPPLSSIIDFSPKSADQGLFDDEMLRRVSFTVHDILDLAYSRTDSSQAKSTELRSLNFLRHGKLKNGLNIIKERDVNFYNLPDHLITSLSGNGEIPSGRLSYRLIAEDSGAKHLLLIELKDGEEIIRAYNGPLKTKEISERSIKGLGRVKTAKACSRFREFLKGVSYSDLGFLLVDNLKALVAIFASLGDDQSRKIGSENGIKSNGILIRMNQEAKIPLLVQLFGTSKDIEMRLLEKDKKDFEQGIGGVYHTLLFLRPHSTSSGGADWNSMDGPSKTKLEVLFETLMKLAQEFEVRVRRETGVSDFRLIAQAAAPVRKKYNLRFSANGLEQFKDRITGRDDQIEPHGDTIYLGRPSRDSTDIFSLGFEIKVARLRRKKTKVVVAHQVTEDTKVSLVETMHRGFVFVLRIRDRELFQPYLHEFREEVNKILEGFELVKDDFKKYHRPMYSGGVIKPAHKFFALKWNGRS